jgi:hypothetical protein
MIAKRAAAVRGSYEGMIRQLEDELHESDELTFPNVERLDQIAPFVAKMRIAKGVSQTELAGRLGVSNSALMRFGKPCAGKPHARFERGLLKAGQLFEPVPRQNLPMQFDYGDEGKVSSGDRSHR